MDKCLVITVPGSFDNENLPVYGYMALHVTKDTSVTEQKYMEILSAQDIEVKSTNGNHLSLSAGGEKVNSIIVQGAAQERTNIYIDNDTYDIMIEGKGEEVLKYFWPGATTLVSGDIAEFVNSYTANYNVGQLNLRNSGFYGSIDSFKDINTNLYGLIIESTAIEGDIKNLAKSIKLANLYSNGSGIYGTVEELANGMVANGRNNGTLAIYGSDTGVTYNGNHIPADTGVSIRFGTSMENPTQEDTERGWQAV